MQRRLLLALAAAAVPTVRAAGEPGPVPRPWPARRPTPALTLPSWEGPAWTLAGALGQVVVLNFWASWCEPCRAEVFLKSHGWVAMDPADVLKVMRQETPEWIKDPKHPLVAPVNAGLFGSWEGNWLGWNTAHDITLPGSAAKATLPFLMYPNGENASGQFDSLSPDTFMYTISGCEIV